MVVTRSLFKVYVRAAFENLPDELLMEILAHLKDRDLGVALCTSKRFYACREAVWREASAKRWPTWFAVARGSEIPWRRQYEMLSLRERELLVLPSLAAIQKKQTVVNAQNRAVLTEWLAEVSWDWQLESTIVFKAAAYLDHYLMNHSVSELGGFQLVGIACLRVAMGDVQQRSGQQDEEEEKKAMDPARFAYISDRTYTAAQVEEMTAVVQTSTCDDLRTCPNAKMFLRSFWYRSVQGGAINKEEMHIYTLASFFLQLALLDLDLSTLPASLLAACALANSMELFGKNVWPNTLQHYSAYTAADLATTRTKLNQVQGSTAAEHIRALWRKHHEHHGYEEYREEWTHALQVIASPCPAPAVKCTSDTMSSSSTQTIGPM
ncbi:g2483 [Coccomyxa elongata]